ncbi:MAG: putative motility protein [Firmicutes bacterium HGW-Firmicutes-5]|nr:MAG: putative motility protein [Firmicutes bacterium HGW-Firmicutes-5]
MDIAALSMGMSQMQVAQQTSISVMKMMAMVETSIPAAAVTGPAPDPNIGQLLDVSV